MSCCSTLYYASLTGPGYGVGGRHDWDLTDKGSYGTYNADTDHDGVKFEANVLVGRASVVSEAEASAFVAKVIAYESFRRPDGSLIDENWPRRILLAAANFNWRVSVTQGAASPPADQKVAYGRAPAVLAPEPAGAVLEFRP